MNKTEIRVVSGIIEQTHKSHFPWMKEKDGTYVYNDDNLALRISRIYTRHAGMPEYMYTLQIFNLDIDGLKHVGHVEIMDCRTHFINETVETSLLAQLFNIIELSNPMDQLSPTRENVLSGVLHALNKW